MPRKRTLIPSPLAWSRNPMPVRAAPLPVLAERGGTQLHTPLPVAIIDTREQNPLSFRRFRKWFADIEERALPLGDYSIRGMERLLRGRAQRSRRPDSIVHHESPGLRQPPAPHERTSPQPARGHRSR